MYNDKRTAKLGLDSQTTYFEPGVDCWDNISGDTWGLTALNIPKLWNHKKEFVPVKVGIVDTGFLSNKDKTTVDDLNYINIINSVDVKDAIQKELTDSPIAGNSAHGTSVLSIIAAEHNNKGICGVATNVKTYAYDYNGVQTSMDAKYSYAILIGNHVKVINVSLSYKGAIAYAACNGNEKAIEKIKKDADVMTEYLRKFISNGYDFVIVVAAGNNQDDVYINDNNSPYGLKQNGDMATGGLSVDNLAKYSFYLNAISDSLVEKRIIVVGGINYLRENNTTLLFRSKFSNLGERVDIYAPGEQILTAVPFDENKEGYGLRKGTSYAAPYISGIIATMYQVNPKMNADRVKDYLRLCKSDLVIYEKYIESKMNETYYIPDAEKCYQYALNSSTSNGNESSLPTGVFVVEIKNSSGNSLDAVMISAIRNDDGESRIENNCFSFSTDLNGYSTNPLPQGKYDILISKKNYDPITIKNVEIKAGKETFYSLTMNTSEISYGGYNSVKGEIRDALNGISLSDVDVKLRKGWNNYEGKYVKMDLYSVASACSDSQGCFSISVPKGMYTAEVSKEGYITGYFNVYSATNTKILNFTISPIIDDDECRIILTWSDIPEDLDAHLTYYKDNSQRFHISFSDKVASTNGKGGATLDLDDVESYGPETVTIKSVHSILENGGILKFSVHNFSSYKSDDKMELSMSDAVVRVYMGNNLIETIYIPVKKEGNVWYVFELTEEGIDIKNEFYNAESEEVK